MSDWPTFYLIAWWVAVAAAVCAVIALPLIYRRGCRQIDEACREVFTERDRLESISNVRRLRADEIHRRMMRGRNGDAS